MNINFENHRAFIILGLLIIILSFPLSNFSSIGGSLPYDLKDASFLDKYVQTKIVLQHPEYGKKRNPNYGKTADPSVKRIMESYGVTSSYNDIEYITDYNNVIKREISIKLTYIHLLAFFLFSYGYLIMPMRK